MIQPKKKDSEKAKTTLDVNTIARQNDNFILEIENYDVTSRRKNDVQGESEEERIPYK